MKKFINEYKALRSKSATTTSKNKVRERVTVSVSSEAITSQEVQGPTQNEDQDPAGTIRTQEYKRDLAEFQARRSLGSKETDDKPELPDTPVKKKCGRHSLPCTDCSTAHDNTFNYEKKSATKYKKKTHKRAKSMNPEEKVYDRLPNIQFLFQNQVFMPGNYCSTYSEPQRSKRNYHKRHRSPDFTEQTQIDFDENQALSPTPMFYKNNSLPVDPKYFLDGSVEEVDGANVRVSSQSSEEGSGPKKYEAANDEKLWEVMSELKNLDQWADEQLGQNTSVKSDDSKVAKSDDGQSDNSIFGLPIASASNLNIDRSESCLRCVFRSESDNSIFGLPIASASNLNIDRSERAWSKGRWGVVPVQVKKVTGVNLDMVRRKQNTEIDILRKCRHPNIILLMGLYPDVHNNIHIICEQCINSLYGILHIQGRILSAQTSVQYALDIASALVFLRMRGYIHTSLTSHCVMVTSHNAAKLADLGSSVKLPKDQPNSPKKYDTYSNEPQYVNIDATHESTPESESLLSKNASETYLAGNAVAKEYKLYRESEHYRWHAPELFEPDETQSVHPCVKSDVYSLCLILWECCNAAVPWKTLTYEKLKELYTLWKTGIRLPQDGTYPGCLLALLQSGLTLSRADRIDLDTLHSTLLSVKTKLDDLEYIIIPARLSKKKSNFSSVAWDINSPTDDSECQSPEAVQNVHHQAIVHKINSSSDTSEKDAKSDSSHMYETIRKDMFSKPNTPQMCYISDDDHSEEKPKFKYEHIPEKATSSACSTPIAKIRARIKDIDTPGALHRSDSTEYCSILSPDNRHFAIDDSTKDQSTEKATAKLSRSFTPKSYKPLHITVPEFNLDTVKSVIKDGNGTEKSAYNFHIKNYSLPSTPIARSNKLRKNAWLSGDLGATERMCNKLEDLRLKTPPNDANKEAKRVSPAPETSISEESNNSPEKANSFKTCDLSQSSCVEDRSPGTDCLDRDSFTGLRKVDPPPDFSPDYPRPSSYSYRSTLDRPNPVTKVVSDDALARVNVRPLVAIHERWIYEANRNTARSMSLPEHSRSQIPAVKPASHCVDTLQKSLPQLNIKRAAPKQFKSYPISPASSGKSGSHWDTFSQAREAVARSMTFGARDPDRFRTWSKDKCNSTVTIPESTHNNEPKIDQATDTSSIESFIRDMIRKEFQHLIHEISDDASNANQNEDVINKGVANIVENLKSGDTDGEKKEVKSFSRVKINGNNKPLLQITFTRSGENTLQVLDNCVNVTICEPATGAGSGGSNKLNVSFEDTLTADDGPMHSLKRCQAFSAIQEARSTEDLYIDDDLSTHMQESFGRVKLIPLHGSLHEVLCEREGECCLLKVKQENGCDTIYFRCDNSDTESRDAIDGSNLNEAGPQDTVVYKRSISLVEERIERIFPKRGQTPIPRKQQETNRTRPKSEIFPSNLTAESRHISASSPSLSTKDKEVEINIENVMSYQDSSSEECIRCQLENDDFELLEQKIEEDLANSRHLSSLNKTCVCLQKISEENLSNCGNTSGNEDVEKI